MKQPETLFKEKVQRRLRQEFGGEIWFFKTSERSVRGIPDIVICYCGRLVVWELKVDSPLETLQEHVLRRVKAAGGVARVVTPKTLPEAIRELKEMKHG